MGVVVGVGMGYITYVCGGVGGGREVHNLCLLAPNVFGRSKNDRPPPEKHTDINPFTAPACEISGLKNAHMHASKEYI